MNIGRILYEYQNSRYKNQVKDFIQYHFLVSVSKYFSAKLKVGNKLIKCGVAAKWFKIVYDD